MPSKKVLEIQKIYNSFYQAIIDYLIKHFGLLGRRIIINVVIDIAKEFPEIRIDVNGAKKNPTRLPKYTLPDRITVAQKIKLCNSILNLIQKKFKTVMGPAGEGILRNAVGPAYERNEKAIKALGIKLPRWLASQMRKRSLIGMRMAEAFGGI